MWESPIYRFEEEVTEKGKIVKKPFYKEDPMVWSETKRKWYVISKHGEWLLFADKESEIEWKTIE